MATYCSHRPRAYAANKRQTMIDRWNSEQGDAVRRFGPLLFPGIPPEALIGFSANSQGPGEVVSQSFTAIGLYNTPTGTDATIANGGAWRQIALSPEFLELVGREGHLGSGWQRAILDQTVIGLIDYRDDISNISSRIPLSLRPSFPPADQWAWACAAMGYVESNGAVRAIELTAGQLAEYPVTARFGALLANMAQVGYTRATAYPLVRAWQRLECGRVLAEATGGDTRWFDLYLGEFTDAVEDRITRAVYGEPDCELQPGALGPVGMGAIPSGVGFFEAVAVAGLIGIGGKLLWDGTR